MNTRRLWDKGEAVDELMQALTVGKDPEIDRAILEADCLGSAAHARMLLKIGILNKDETSALLNALAQILSEAKAGTFEIPRELEDAHTAIENRLVERCGEAGQKIHTGRSRNDQVLLATRLFMRDETLRWMRTLLTLAATFGARFDALKDIPMPGYTHMQPAMPSSVGMWLHAFMEGTLEFVRDGFALHLALDANPLGSAAGFGSSLPLDREYVAQLLGFSRVQRSFIDVQNSRGRGEEKFIFWAGQIAGLYEKFAFDVVLGCTKEFGFFSLPARLTTGSSIMPQKRNPDIAELLRGRAGKIRAALYELSWVSGKLPSSYHRDLQFTKEPLMRVVDEIPLALASVGLILDGLEVHTDRLKAAMLPELYATYEAYRQVHEGVPFRTAYRATADLVKGGAIDVSRLQSCEDAVKTETAAAKLQADTEMAALDAKLGALEAQRAALEQRLFEA